jgi:predicted nuclease of predicted toxin-antitoxin system
VEFLANENFPLLSIRLLRAAGHKVISVAEELPGGKDDEVLKYAEDASLVIITFDRDYGELIYRHTLIPPAGVVYFRFPPSKGEEPGEMLLAIIEQGQIALSGKFTVVERSRIRQRRLPKRL